LFKVQRRNDEFDDWNPSLENEEISIQRSENPAVSLHPIQTILALKNNGHKSLKNISHNSMVSGGVIQTKHASKNKGQANFSNFHVSQMESLLKNDQFDYDAGLKNENMNYDSEFAKQIAVIQKDSEVVLRNEDPLTMVSKDTVLFQA